jgi:hypothetical protein
MELAVASATTGSDIFRRSLALPADIRKAVSSR